MACDCMERERQAISSEGRVVMQNTIDKFKAEVRKELGVQSNADRIRSFSDDELAEFIEQVSTDSMETISFGTKEYEEIWEHKETALQWLQSEVEK